MSPSNIPIRNFWTDFNLNRRNASFLTFLKSRASNFKLRNYITLTTLIILEQSTNWVNQKNLANAMMRCYIFKNVQSPSLTEIQVVQDKINLLSVKSEKRLRSNYQSLKKTQQIMPCGCIIFHTLHQTLNCYMIVGHFS